MLTLVLIGVPTFVLWFFFGVSLWKAALLTWLSLLGIGVVLAMLATKLRAPWGTKP